MRKNLLTIPILWLLSLSCLYAQEGTKQLMPNPSDINYLNLNNPNTEAGVTEYFATESATNNPAKRLNIRLQVGEILHFGFKLLSGNPNQTSFRIKDPNGNVVLIGGNERNPIPTSGAGYIDTYNEAIKGPEGAILNGVTTTAAEGYTPLTYTAVIDGDHYIEFQTWDGTDFNTANKTNTGLIFQYIDFTVTDASNNIITNPDDPSNSAGRIWARQWTLNTNGSGNPVPSDFSIYVFIDEGAGKGFVNRVKFDMNPFGYGIVSNSFGAQTTGTPAEQRKSRDFNTLASDPNPEQIAQHRIFFNNPDAVIFEDSDAAEPIIKGYLNDILIYDYDYSRGTTEAERDQSPSISGLQLSTTCGTGDAVFRIESNIEGQAAILLDINNDGDFEDPEDVSFLEDISIGTNTITWVGMTDGQGNPLTGLPKTVGATASFLFRASTHFPLYDVEQLRNLITEPVRPFTFNRGTAASPDNTTTIFWDDTDPAIAGTSQLEAGSTEPRNNGAGSVNGNNTMLNTWANSVSLGLPSFSFEVVSGPTPPADKTVTATSPVCAGESVTITVEDADAGVNYELRDVDNNVIETITGTGDISFTALTPTATTTYSVFGVSTGCAGTQLNGGAGIAITVNPAPTITLGASPSVISGTTSANLPYTATTNSPNQYTIDFDALAEGEGFADVAYTALPASPISIVVPAGAAIGTYNATIRVRNNSTGCESAAVPFTVEVAVAPASTDLSIVKTVDNSTPDVGSNIVFTLTVSNNGPDGATGVSVTDLLPSGYTYVSDVPSVGTYNNTTGVWTVGNLANGANATLAITVTVNATGDYANTATVSGNESDPDPSDDSDTETTTPVPVADLSIVKTVDDNTPDVGSNITFTLTLSNNGPSAATGVIAADILPSGYTYVSDVPSVGTYDNTTGVWTVGNLANGANATLDIEVTVNATGDYTNTATASGNESDPDPSNDSDSETTTPALVADLSIVKTVDNNTPNVGSNVTFTLTLSNNGPNAATGVSVSDLLPSGYTYVSDVPSLGTYDNTTGVWTVGNLANGASATLDIEVSVNATGDYVNTATVSGNESDPDPSDDSDTETTTPVAIADLSMVKTVDNNTPNVGSNITFTLTLSNSGPSAATGVSVTDLLPSGYTYVSDVPSVGTYDNTTGIWTVGNLASGANATLDIEVTVNATGDYANTATASGNESDPDPSNDSDTETTIPCTINSNLDVTASSTNVCANEDLVISILNFETDVTYILRDDADDSVISTNGTVNGNNLEFTVNPTANITYNVLAQKTGCNDTELTQTVSVTVSPAPLLEINIETDAQQIGCGGEINIRVDGIETITSVSPLETVSAIDGNNVRVKPTEATTYTITGIDANGCSSSETVEVEAGDINRGVFIPTLFTPNGDGSNETFIIHSNCISEIELFIFDRSGHQVYYTNDVFQATQVGWDGNAAGGRPQPEGTYSWRIIGTFLNGEAIGDSNKTTGIVNLAR